MFAHTFSRVVRILRSWQSAKFYSTAYFFSTNRPPASFRTITTTGTNCLLMDHDSIRLPRRSRPYAALATIFNQSQTRPFHFEALIQKFVMANPIPRLVSRVAQVVCDNGPCVREI